MIEFQLNDSDYIQLCDLLKAAGLSDSGGVAKLLISEGHVKVDGNVELRKRCKIRKNQTIEFEGQTVKVI